MVAEAIIGEYGKEVYGEGFSNYALKFVKSFGKLFIYPQHNSQSFVLFFSGVLLLISSSFIAMFYYRREHFPGYTFLWLALVIAHIIPGFFGVDTHTSDGERLLYFPSFFVCAALAFAICSFIPSKTWQAFMLLLLLVCNVYYLEKGKKNWIKADAAINNINYSLKQFSGKPLYLINIPDAIDGSFVYRNGFREAMAVNQISDSNITVVNYLLNKDAHLLNNIISPSLVSSSAMRIPPVVKVSEGSIDINTLRKDGWHKKRIQRKKGSTVLFWNGTKMVLLQ